MVERKLTRREARARSQSPEAIRLPRPAPRHGRSLVTALRLRRTTREISRKKLRLQTLSDLLWAGCGVNRETGPFGMAGRTAASASDSQEVDVYVALESGTYLYDPFEHALVPVVADDVRLLVSGPGQGSVGAEAPVRLIYVADVDRLANTSGFPEPGLRDPDVQRAYCYIDTGMIAANVYLFAAAMGLAAWFHNCDKAALSAKLRLRPDQRVLFGQTVGYPLKGRSKANGRSRPS